MNLKVVKVMAYHELEPSDEKFLEECPVCKKGYMVPTMGNWYKCSICDVEAEENDFGLVMLD